MIGKHYFKIVAIAALVTSSTVAFADRHDDDREDRGRKHGKHRPHYEEYRHGKHHHKHREVVYYRPKWHPECRMERRWVYFPKYNMYWDNYNDRYAYCDRGRWVVTRRVPQVVVNVNLARERYYELEEEYDERDNVFSLNIQNRISLRF